jgi:peptidoglycan/xylan/chitin deacetylase (PgdA/CDA1 family)
MRRLVVVTLVAIAVAGCGGGPVSEVLPHRRGAVAARTQPVPHRRHAVTPRAALRRFARLGRPLYCGGRRSRLVALTFDDGPGPYTRLALRELHAAHVRATFFLVARSIARFPGEVRWERAAGAAIGDHTSTHPFLPALALRAAIAQIAGGRAAARAASGRPVVLFRPPYGAHTPAIDRALRRRGMVEVMWDVDSGDSRVVRPEDYRAIAAAVLGRIRPGSIVLMHENRGQTIRALRLILPALRRRGLHPVTVPQLLAADPPTRRVLDAGAAGCGAWIPGGG